MNMLTRDARHLALKQVGSEGQQQIAAGTALLIGAGGIGCAAATYLAASGVGHLVISDFDTVDETNLGRQVLYTSADIGELKAEVAASRLRASNPGIQISVLTQRLQGNELVDAIQACDVVLDGSDNFATRFAVNDACVDSARRLISGSAIRMEGQLAVFGEDYSATPCYRCLYVEEDESLDSCAGNGVLSPIPAVIGTLMAVEALKFFVGIGANTSFLRLYDAVATDFRSITLRKRDDCPACAKEL